MRLRPYQSALVAELDAAFAQHRAVLLQLPTGGGKRYIAAHVAGMAASVGERVWIIAHRREIVGQTSAAIGELGVAHAVVAPGRTFEPDCLIQVCSVASLSRRADNLPPPDMMIFDEAHHIASASWSSLRARYPQARCLGLTATPARLDGKGLDAHFDTLITGPSTAELMAAGHLSRYRLFAPTIPDLRGVGTRAGDYARDQLTERMSTTTLVGDVVEHYQRLAAGCRAVAFAVSVEASRTIVARFNAAGIPAAHIDGSTHYTIRDQTVADLEAGRLRVLSNVEVFTEGFDLPAIDAVILLRPTKSLALYRQMVGRGLRAAEGKAPTIILDHAGLIYDHDLPDEPMEWTLAGVRKRPGAKGIERLRRCPECTAVREWAAVCTECGHEYTAADRTIEEVYGELREVGRTGLSFHAFAAQVGVCAQTVRAAIPKGLPLEADGSVAAEPAAAWWQGYRRVFIGPTPEGFETVTAFARRVGIVPSGAVHRLVRESLPLSPVGLVPIADGLAWYADYRAQVEAQSRGSVAGFARRMGVADYTVVLAKRRGLPLTADGQIDVEAAIVWWEANPPSTKVKPPDGYETTKAFCLRVGITPNGNGRLRLLRLGLPIASNGFVHIETALAWLEADPSRRPHRKARKPP